MIKKIIIADLVMVFIASIIVFIGFMRHGFTSSIKYAIIMVVVFLILHLVEDKIIKWVRKLKKKDWT